MAERNRRTTLEGLQRILDAGGLEELFAGPDDEAAFLRDLLVEAARGRDSRLAHDIRRTARRRGVTAEFVADRAALLCAAMDERRRADLYRILDAPPLASADVLRQRWLDFAKANHPDVGGDPARFRRAKEAWEVLRDPGRRADYERFWLRALSPFERVVAADARAPAAMAGPGARAAQRGEVGGGAVPVVPAAPGGLGPLIARLRALLAAVSGTQVERLRTEVLCAIARLEAFRAHLQQIAALKRVLSVALAPRRSRRVAQGE